MPLRPLCAFIAAAILSACCAKQPSTALPQEDRNERLTAFLARYVDENDFTGAILIAEKGKILHKKGYGFADRDKKIPNTPTTRFSLQSLSKIFTLGAVIREQDRGALNIEDKVDRFIPDYPHGDRIKLSHLMYHRSGIVDIYNDYPYDPSEHKEPVTLECLVERFKHLPLEFDPGSQMEYSNSGYILLAHVIEKTSGKSFNSYVEQNLLKPAGMADSTAGRGDPASNNAIGYESYEDNVPYPRTHLSHIVGAGNLYSTVEDLFRWYQASHSLDALHASAHAAGFGGGLGFRSAFVPIPPLDIVIILLSNRNDPSLEDRAWQIERILLADRRIDLEPSVLDDFVGTYRTVTFDFLVSKSTIQREKDHLLAYADRPGRGRSVCELHPISANQFLVRAEESYEGIVLTFHRNGRGRVDRMTADDHGVRMESVRVE